MNHEPLRYAHEEGLTDVAFSSDGLKFITCGIDGDLRIWSTDEGEDPIHCCIGEWACSVREKLGKLYVATGSNDVQILTFPDGERDGVLDRFVAPINHIAVGLDSEYMALAGEDMEVKLVVFEDSAWRVEVFETLRGPVLSVAINGRFIAASSGDSKLRVWTIDTKELVKEIECFEKVNSFANAKSFCRLDFQPGDGKFLAYPHKASVVLLSTFDWTEFATLTCKDINSDFSLVQFSPCGKFLVGTTVKGDFALFSVTSEKVELTSKHPNSAAISGIMWNPLGNGQIVYTDMDGQLGIINDCLPKKTSGESQSQKDDDVFTENNVDFGNIQFEDDDDDNENAISLEKIKKQVMGDEESELNFDARSPVPTPRPRTPEIPLQEAFMPSSSPEHLNPRYLCWNEMGVVKSYGLCGDEDTEKSIEIEFHDSTFHNSMILQNYQDYKFGSLSKAALAVANTKQISVIPLQASNKEWMLKLDEQGAEEVKLIAASENLICFGTTNYLVRMCSIFGTQMGVVYIPGPLVSMSAFKNSVLVAYHSGAIRKGDQTIDIKLIKMAGLAVESVDFRAALGPESTLCWVGFTDVGTPAVVDSLGLVSLLCNNTWIPISDTSLHLKSPSDTFFVTCVDESHQVIIGIKCKGSLYPGFTPRPTPCELNFEPPFVEPHTEKAQLEQNLFTWSNSHAKNIEKRFTEQGLKAFVLACKNNLDQRAVELLEILGNPLLLNLSTKYAVKLKKRTMAEKLMELAGRIMADVDDNEVAVTPEVNPPTNRISLKRTPKVPRPPPPEHQTLDPIPESQNSSLNLNLSATFNDTIPTAEEPRNPFANNAKKNQNASTNPLSLVNKFAGVEYLDHKENKKIQAVEKRKQPDSGDTDKQREKQRKLDKFMFTKRPKD